MLFFEVNVKYINLQICQYIILLKGRYYEGNNNKEFKIHIILRYFRI